MSDQIESTGPLRPVAQTDRIDSLDILRGIAVLGILLMNIVGFALLPQAYGNPFADGGATGPNRDVFVAMTVGFEGTMRGIFSILFGASIVLLTERMERAGAGLATAEIYFRRTLWLLLFGIIHWTLMLWFGEILFGYAMCGLVLFSFRKLAPRWLLLIAAPLLLFASFDQYQTYHSTMAQQAAASEAETAKAAGASLTGEQERVIEAWQEQLGHVMPNDEMAEHVRATHSGSWWNAVTSQFDFSYTFQWTDAPYWYFTDMIPFMLIGMALLKLGVLPAALPARTYAAMIALGYGVGIPLGIYETGLLFDGGFSPVAVAKANMTYQISRLAMVTGHLGLVLLVVRTGLLRAPMRVLAATGQMALSNYLAQTIICVALFYGFGFGLFGRFERIELYMIVAAIWAAELIWSPLWLARFRFGPFEWLWRTLTYWRVQPFRR
jgi:uncharacterized protein